MAKVFAGLAALTGASAQNAWSIIANNIATEGTGISFNTAPGGGSIGFFAGGINGVGACVLKSTDGGNTWAQTSDPFELLVLDVTSYGNNVLASATLGAEYSNDAGATFNSSTCDQTPVSQCSRNLGSHDSPLGFTMTGSFGLFTELNGVAISRDHGKTFASQNISVLQTFARYGAFPTANTWYVTAGQWPGEGNDQTGTTSTTSSTTTIKTADGSVMREVTGKLSVYSNAKKRAYGHAFGAPAERSLSPAGRATQASNNTYVGQIVKNVGGAGGNWSSQFITNAAYLNGIDCLDENRCCAVGENDDAPPAGGAFVWCTQNGGASWTAAYANTNYTGASLLDLRVVGTDGYWAVGGIINGAPEAAVFLYSGDAGATWTVDSVIQNQYVTAVDCIQGTQECWATLIDLAQQTSVAYAATSVPSKRAETPKEKAIRAAWANSL